MQLSTLGERICYCRNLLGLTQREFALEFGIGKATITRWELNATQIPPKQILALTEFFLNRNIQVTQEWLLFGSGALPISPTGHQIENLNFDEIAYTYLKYIKENIVGLEIFQVNTKFFEPILSFADYCAGIFENNYKKLDNKFCFVNTKQTIIVGLFRYNNDKESSLTNLSNEYFNVNLESSKVGEILWTAKRF